MYFSAWRYHSFLSKIEGSPCESLRINSWLMKSFLFKSILVIPWKALSYVIFHGKLVKGSFVQGLGCRGSPKHCYLILFLCYKCFVLPMQIMNSTLFYFFLVTFRKIDWGWKCLGKKIKEYKYLNIWKPWFKEQSSTFPRKLCFLLTIFCHYSPF